MIITDKPGYCMKSGILGGTFDPVHKGHITMARLTKESLGLDNILFMPSGNPPHKTHISDNRTRMDMLNLALKHYPDYYVSDFEFKREGIIYTSDTLTLLCKENPDTEYTFIIGADSLYNLHQWHRPDIICKKADIAVCARKSSSHVSLSTECTRLTSKYGARIHVIDFPCIDISSHEIRDNIYTNPDMITEYLNDDVYRYIIQKGLYKNEGYNI